MVALGLYHQNLPTVEHHDDVGIGVNGPVNLEAQSGNIPVPPLDVAQLRQCPHHLELVLVHIFFGGIERFRHHRGKCRWGDHRRQRIVGQAGNLVLLQPGIKDAGAMLGNQFLYLSLNFHDIGIRRLLQLGELIFAHGADHPVDVLIQFPVIDAVHLGELLLDNALAQREPLFRGLGAEPLPEKGAVATR